MSSSSDVAEFFDDYYRDHAANPRAQEWRAALARYNADAIERGLAALGARPRTIVEVGCGDGALLSEFARRGIGSEMTAFEISGSAVEYVRRRSIPGLIKAEIFDGERVPESSGAFDLAVLSHVIEHAGDPRHLIRETARLAPLICLQVILADTRRSGTAARRAARAVTGHLHVFNRDSALELLRECDLTVRHSHVGRAPIALNVFWDRSGQAHLRAYVGAAINRLAPRLSDRWVAKDLSVLCAAA